MVNRLPAWLFLSLGLLLIGMALLPILRAALNIDQQISLQFWTVVILLIGGLMCALTAMILLLKRQPRINWPSSQQESALKKTDLLAFHSCGLLLFTAVPLLNFLVAYYLWVKNRNKGEGFDRLGQEVVNFQITIYLYILLSLFLVFAIIGIATTPIILVFHFVVTVIAMIYGWQGKPFSYPANIPIFQGREK